MTRLRPRRLDLWRMLMVDGYPLELRVLTKVRGSTKVRGYSHWARTPSEVEAKVRSQLERPGVLYYGALPRARPNSRDLVAGRVLWVDCDDPSSVKALDKFPHAPNAVIESGSVTDGVPHLHALWFLDELLRPEEIMVGCRKLAHKLGADLASAEAARILKVPGSRSEKPGAHAARIARLSKAPYRASRLLAGLPTPVDLRGRTARANGAPMANGNGGRTADEWFDLLSTMRGVQEGRHETFMAICGLLVVKLDTMPADQVCEIAVAVGEHTQDPPYPRAELERCFYDVWEEEYRKRYGEK